MAATSSEIDYSSNTNNTVYITNAGTTAHKTLCADIYVFAPQQELNECRTCAVTPDGLLTLPLINLTGNPLTGFTFGEGTVKIASSSGSCGSSGYPLPTAPTPEPGIHAWITHDQYNGLTTFVTETSFLDYRLSAAELSRLGAQCNEIKIVGSGKGVCSWCCGRVYRALVCSL